MRLYIDNAYNSQNISSHTFPNLVASNFLKWSSSIQTKYSGMQVRILSKTPLMYLTLTLCYKSKILKIILINLLELIKNEILNYSFAKARIPNSMNPLHIFKRSYGWGMSYRTISVEERQPKTFKKHKIDCLL